MRLNCHHFKVCMNLRGIGLQCVSVALFVILLYILLIIFICVFCLFLILFISFGFSSFFFSALPYYIGRWDGIFSGILIYY